MKHDHKRAAPNDGPPITANTMNTELAQAAAAGLYSGAEHDA